MIDSLFSMINFFLFCALCAFVWKKYIGPQVQEEIKKDQGVARDHEQQQKILEREQCALQDRQSYQKQLYESLMQKTSLWYKSIEEQERSFEQLAHQCLHEAQQRRKTQDAHLLTQKIARDIVQQSFETVQKTLTKKYEPVAERQKYQDALIQQLGEL